MLSVLENPARSLAQPPTIITPESPVPPLMWLLNEELTAAGKKLGRDMSKPNDLWSPTVFAQSLCSPLSRVLYTPMSQASPSAPQEHLLSRDTFEREAAAPEEDHTAASSQIAGEILERWSTTLMIRNLPNKLTPPMIMECVDELGFANEYDYLFVPIDTNAPGWANRNLGYCFLNLTTPEIAKRFCEVAYGYSFRQAVSSTKTSKISIAEEQGVLKNLRRIDRAGPRKDHRAGKHCSLPYVRVNGQMEAMAPAMALQVLSPGEPVSP
jgi:hypothetical protein